MQVGRMQICLIGIQEKNVFSTESTFIRCNYTLTFRRMVKKKKRTTFMEICNCPTFSSSFFCYEHDPFGLIPW